jgi:phospholipid/cholesterol/gamma-HCH transport system permease protein
VLCTVEPQIVSEAPQPLDEQASVAGRLGGAVVRTVRGAGELTVFTGRLFSWLLTRWPAKGSLVPCLYQIGVLSLPVVMVTGLFIGMVLAVQSYGQFANLHMETRLGSIINIALVKELGPVLAATMLAGRVGSAMAAELGTMRVTEQIDALSCLGANPIHYLVVPRFLACFFLVPLLAVIADMLGVMGGAIVCVNIFGVSSHHYWQHSRAYVEKWDIYCGIFKSFFFGAAIAIIACHRGLNSRAGAEGVGRAATEAFVYSFIAILAVDFLLGVLLQSVYELFWPIATSAI